MAWWRGSKGLYCGSPPAASASCSSRISPWPHDPCLSSAPWRLGSAQDASAACHVGFEGCSQQRGIRCAWGSGVGLRLPPQQRALGPKGQRAKPRPMHGQRAQRCARRIGAAHGTGGNQLTVTARVHWATSQRSSPHQIHGTAAWYHTWPRIGVVLGANQPIHKVCTRFPITNAHVSFTSHWTSHSLGRAK